MRDIRIGRLLAITFCGVLLLQGCVTPAPTEVSFLPASEVSAPGTALPHDGYLSTGQPDAAALKAIAAAGYAGVVDLRSVDEPRGFDEAATAASLGLHYRSLPVAGPDGVTFENAAKLDALLAEYDGPVLLHCSSGNRVGALLALR
ncbi:MAG: sulfur transferase domain-containing protein, partial [Woeseia sp.]